MKSKSSTRRWREPTRSAVRPSPPADMHPGADGSGEPDTPRRGPYETSYDITHGYGEERSILLP